MSHCVEVIAPFIMYYAAAARRAAVGLGREQEQWLVTSQLSFCLLHGRNGLEDGLAVRLVYRVPKAIGQAASISLTKRV